MTAPNLKNLQIEFKKYLFTGTNEDAMVPLVNATNNIGATTRLNVYFNAYYLRLEESLGGDFPLLLAVLGEERFSQIAVHYLRDNPSQAPSLRFLGRNLAAWLMDQSETEWADIARLEWAVLNAFDAPENTSLAVNCLADIQPLQWPELLFSFHPSVTLVQANVNAFAMWTTVRQQTQIPTCKKLDNPEYLAVWRSGVNPTLATLTHAEYTILISLKKNNTFAESCQRLSRSIDAQEVPNIAAQTLSRALQSGWITKITF